MVHTTTNDDETGHLLFPQSLPLLLPGGMLLGLRTSRSAAVLKKGKVAIGASATEESAAQLLLLVQVPQNASVDRPTTLNSERMHRGPSAHLERSTFATPCNTVYR